MDTETKSTIEQLFNEVQRAIRDDDYTETLEKIGELADIVNESDTDETIWSMGESGEFTLDALLAGAYWHCAGFHGGQWSAQYKLLCQIGNVFHPGPITKGPKTDSDESHVYDILAGMHG